MWHILNDKSKILDTETTNENFHMQHLPGQFLYCNLHSTDIHLDGSAWNMFWHGIPSVPQVLNVTHLFCCRPMITFPLAKCCYKLHIWVFIRFTRNYNFPHTQPVFAKSLFPLLLEWLWNNNKKLSRALFLNHLNKLFVFSSVFSLPICTSYREVNGKQVSSSFLLQGCVHPISSLQK